MEKISRILPSNPRVQAVDLKSSAPVRPGTPQFGRPVGISSLADAFFMRKMELDNAPTPISAREDLPVSLPSSPMEMPPTVHVDMEQDLDSPEVGRYLDVVG